MPLKVIFCEEWLRSDTASPTAATDTCENKSRQRQYRVETHVLKIRGLCEANQRVDQSDRTKTMADQVSDQIGGGNRSIEAGRIITDATRTGRWPIVALVLIVVLAHVNGLSGRFYFDDVGAIVDNPTIRDLSDLPTVLFDASFTTVVNRPLLNL
jgi:hypothetical protein